MKTAPHDHALSALLRRVLPVLLVLLLLALFPRSARAQTETLFQGVGDDTARSFAHTGLPVPEPGTAVMWLALGLPALAATALRRRRDQGTAS